MNDGFLKPEVPDWEPKFREKFRGWVTLYEEINAFCYQSLPSELSNLSIPQALCWTLFLRSMATFQTILIVLQKGLESDSKSLLRSLLEVTFVLQATTKRSSFVEEYARSNEWEERKWMEKWNRINKGKDERLQFGRTR